MSDRDDGIDLVSRIKRIVRYLNGEYDNFEPKRMQNDRYLILLYAATMIHEFKQRGTRHGKLLYFSYNELKKISKSPVLDSTLEHPILFESTKRARKIVYPVLKRQKFVRIDSIDVESYKGAQCVAITKRGIRIAEIRLNEIWNGFSKTQISQLSFYQDDKAVDEKLKEDPYQNYGLNRLTTDYFKSHESMQKAFDEWKNGFPFDLSSIKAKRELRREGLIADIKSKLENQGRLLLVGQSGSSKSTILMELMCDYFDAGYDILYNYGMTDIRNEDGLVRFIEYLLENGKKVLVAVDNGHEEKMSSIFYVIDKLFTSTLTRNLRFIIAARIPEFDLLINDSLDKVQEEIRRSMRKIASISNTRYHLPYFAKEEIKQFIKLYFKVNDNDKFDKKSRRDICLY